MLSNKEVSICTYDTCEADVNIINDTSLCSFVIYENNDINVHYTHKALNVIISELISELQIKESISSLVFKAMDTPCELTIEDNGLDVSLGIVADDRQTILVVEEAEECVLTLDNEDKECVLTSYEPLCAFSLMEDCTEEKVYYMRVFPTDVQWVSDAYVVTFEVESNTNWEIV